MTNFTSVACPHPVSRIFFSRVLIFFMMVMGCIVQLQAQSPKISIQGTLKSANGTSVDDGTYNVTFKLYRNEMGGTALWQEMASVDVIGSIYSHYLGSVTPLNAADFDSTLYLGVVVGNYELTPRTELSYSPYAFSVTAAQTVVCSGAVGDVKYSVLQPDSFRVVNGACWVPMDGRNIAGSRLAAMTGWTTVPDAGGLFFRAQEFSGSPNRDPNRSSASTIAQVQNQAVQDHSHNISDPGHTHPYKDIYRNTTSDGGGPGASNRAIQDFTDQDRTTSSSTTGISIPSTGNGPETRPINMNLWVYIRIN